MELDCIYSISGTYGTFLLNRIRVCDLKLSKIFYPATCVCPKPIHVVCLTVLQVTSRRSRRCFGRVLFTKQTTDRAVQHLEDPGLPYRAELMIIQPPTQDSTLCIVRQVE
jgi:hypothetical protein